MFREYPFSDHDVKIITNKCALSVCIRLDFCLFFFLYSFNFCFKAKIQILIFAFLSSFYRCYNLEADDAQLIIVFPQHVSTVSALKLGICTCNRKLCQLKTLRLYVCQCFPCYMKTNWFIIFVLQLFDDMQCMT